MFIATNILTKNNLLNNIYMAAYNKNKLSKNQILTFDITV